MTYMISEHDHVAPAQRAAPQLPGDEPEAEHGQRVTRPVRVRSSVSFAVGSTSSGSLVVVSAAISDLAS